MYKGKHHDAYLSHIKVQTTASRKTIYLILVYDITGHPMMLAPNKEIKRKCHKGCKDLFLNMAH